MDTMLIAHLSDLHVAAPGSMLAAWIDTAARLHLAVDQLNRLRPLPDLVVITGDLVNTGSSDEYAILADALDRLDMPVRVVPGNHDDHTGFGTTFGERQWVEDRFPVRVIGIDTTIRDRHDGHMGAAALTWLDSALASTPDRPTIVCMHHPPSSTGMWWMDYGGLPGRAALRELVAGHACVRAVLAGHVHRRVLSAWGGALLSVAPSLAYESGMGLSPDSPPVLQDLATRTPLYWWDGTELTAYDTDLLTGAPPRSVDLRDIIADWPGYERAARSGGPMPKDH